MSMTTANGHRPAQVTAFTHVTERPQSRILVNVRKEMKPWNRVAFFVFLADQMAAHVPLVPDLQSLADMAQINASTMSKWKTGKTRPTVDSLYAIADALGLKRSEVVARSGILDDGPGGMASKTGDAGLDHNIQRIRSSRLPKAAQDRLVETYLADKAAHEERLARDIALLESMANANP